MRRVEYKFYPPSETPDEKKHGRDFLVVLEHPEYGRKLEFATLNYFLLSDEYEFAGFEAWIFTHGSLDKGETFVAWAPIKVPQGEIK